MATDCTGLEQVGQGAMIHHKSKVQIGNITFDAEVEEETVMPEGDKFDIRKAVSNFRAFIANYPPLPKTVEGSIVEPVTDPARLLEAKEGSE